MSVLGRGGLQLLRNLRSCLAEELGHACSTSAQAAAAGSRVAPQGARHASSALAPNAGQANKIVWPELPSALTAIIGTRQRLGDKGSAAFDNFVRASRRLYKNNQAVLDERKIHVVCNRAYINILSSFSCAPKAQTVIKGLPLVASVFVRGTEASCYTVKTFGDGAGKRKTYPSTGFVQKHLAFALAQCYRRVALVLRGIFLSVLFFPILVGSPLALHFDVGRETWLKMVRRALEIAGPAFVKWGQWASTRRDMFPGDLCEELARLYTCVPSHRYHHTKKLVEAAFGQKIDDMFDYFEEEPCASGSIAQVHKAKLSEKGALRINMKDNPSMMVAVKVRHPGVETKLLRDFELMLVLADLAAELADAHIIGESVRQFRGPLIEQLDLEHEAEALQRFNCNFKRHRDVSFPKPLYPYVSNDVLVETFEDGVVFHEIFDDKKEKWHRKLAQMGLNTLFKMLLEDNFVHADLHPGNILIRFKEPDFWAKAHAKFFGYANPVPRPHITLLDTGMSTSLTHQDQTALMQFFESIGNLDGAYVAETSLKMATIQQFPTKTQFVQEIVELFDTFQIHMKKHDDLPPASDCMSSLLDIFRKHRVGMKSDLSVVIATVFMMEGWATQLDPQLKVMKTIRKFTSYDIQQAFATLCTT